MKIKPISITNICYGWFLNVEIEIVDYAKSDIETKLHTNLSTGSTKNLPDIVLMEDYSAQKYLNSYPVLSFGVIAVTLSLYLTLTFVLKLYSLNITSYSLIA